MRVGGGGGGGGGGKKKCFISENFLSILHEIFYIYCIDNME